MGIRSELAAGLKPHLPELVEIIDHPDDIKAIDPSTRAVLMIVRTDITPANTIATYLNDLELWLIEPTTSTDGTAEDALDELADLLIVALQAQDWLVWSKATRASYDDTWPAYRFQAVVTSHDVPETPPIQIQKTEE